MGVGRDEAIAIATRFLARNGCRVVPRVEGQPWDEDEWLAEIVGCHFVAEDRPLWSVVFKDQLPPDLLHKHPEGPVILVDAESGAADFFAAL